MERITSRKNRLITHLRALANDGAYRREKREYVCDGVKLLAEALSAGAAVTACLWREEAAERFEVPDAVCCCAPEELVQYASPLRSSPGPVFSVKMPDHKSAAPSRNAVVLEGVQDPGNVGTVIRTAAALGIDLVVLTGACADLYHPKTVRATMGAVFRQRTEELSLEELSSLGLPILGAALSDTAQDVRSVSALLPHCAVAVGSEGRGLSAELLEKCERQIIIPMTPGSESLNAAAAAGILMWEMRRQAL